jgi:hypothetical protein
VLGLVPRELRVAVPAGAAAFACLRACRTVAAPIPDAQITALAGVDHNVAATKPLLSRERDNSGYEQGVVRPVAAGLSSTGSSRGQPGDDQRSAPLEAGGVAPGLRWPIPPPGPPAPLPFWSVVKSKFLSNFTANVRAIGLGHIRLACCAVRVGLDPVDGAGDRLEGTCLRGRPVGTGQSLLASAYGGGGIGWGSRTHRGWGCSGQVEATAVDAELVAASAPASIQPISSRPTTRPVAGCADSRWLTRCQSCVVILIACRGGRSIEETMPTDSGIAFRGCAATRPVIEEPMTWVS